MKDVDLESGLLAAAGMQPDRAFVPFATIRAQRPMSLDEMIFRQMQEQEQAAQYQQLETLRFMRQQEEVVRVPYHSYARDAYEFMRQATEPNRDYMESEEIVLLREENARLVAEADRLRAIAIGQAQPEQATPAPVRNLLPYVELERVDNPAFEREQLKQVDGQVVDGE